MEEACEMTSCYCSVHTIEIKINNHRKKLRVGKYIIRSSRLTCVVARHLERGTNSFEEKCFSFTLKNSKQ